LSHHQSTVDTAVITYSSYVTKGSGVTAVGAGISQKLAESPEMLSLADVGVITGIAGVLIGSTVNMVAHYRREKREQELLRLRVKALKEKHDGLM